MQFCINGSRPVAGWTDGGLDVCLVDVVTSAVLFCYILVVTITTECQSRRKSQPDEENLKDDDPELLERSWDSILRLILSIVLLVEALLHAIAQDTVTLNRDIVGYQMFRTCVLISVWLLYIRFEKSNQEFTRKYATSRSARLYLVVFFCLTVAKECLAFVSWFSAWYWWSITSTSDDIEFGLWMVRIACNVLMLISITTPLFIYTPKEHAPVSKDDKEEITKKKLRQESTWTNVFLKLRMMVPYVWPKGNPSKQLLVFLCLVILGIGRGVNLLVPIVSKNIVNELSTKIVDITSDQSSAHTNTTIHIYGQENRSVMLTNEENGDQFMELGPTFCWNYILIYCLLMFLKGSGAGNSGFLNNIRSFLWVPVQQYTTKRIQVHLFDHLQRLSLGWHLKRRTGEVLRIVERGTNSLNTLLSHLLFNILPIIADIIIAIVYFVSAFNYLFGVVVFLCMAFYVGATLALTEWRTRYRRDMNKLDNEKNAKAVDSLLNFETVKYYGASDYEKGQYAAAITKYQKAELVSVMTFHTLNTTQSLIISLGMVSGSLICAWAVVYSVKDLHLSIGDYVLFGTYINQLYGPLHWLGNFYRMIQQSFVDMENMFELFQEDQEVKDHKDAKDIYIAKGKIEFQDVCFHYDPRKEILKNISFCVPAGQTYALVGHSGSGKSTIIRLLFRFYDVTNGSILIDGQDISKVKQESLRQRIGVVPQDTVLFNANIAYNIRYGRASANDQDVEEAAEAADIHDRILTFPSKYDTLVGERGLKLSGGEKQRVAIARTLLKAPDVVLLDEATSALDTKTERRIQNSLARLCENRTTIVVAHRLSTIINSDQILVMKEGEIIERGSHQDLLELNGNYKEMWQHQLSSEEDKTFEEAEI